jgi:flagellar capping protein FliD
MSFDPSVLNQLSDAQLSDVFKFLGSSTTGFGVIASQFKQLSDPISGLIKTEQNGIDAANQRITDQINRLTDRNTAMQNALTQRLQAADAALAGLQSQQQVLTSSVQSVNLALYGKGWANSGS